MGQGLKKICKRHGGLTVTSGGVTKHFTAKDAEDFSFKEMEVISKDGQFKAVWEWIGEGRSGDYNPADPNDFPILRFTCYIKDGEADLNAEDSWTQIEDASFCTAMDARTPRPLLKKALKNSILRELASSYPNHKKNMEWMSWISADEIKGGKEMLAAKIGPNKIG